FFVHNKIPVSECIISETGIYTNCGRGSTETELSKVDGSIVPMDVEKVCFEPHAANKALELLGKHLGMFKDKVDVTNSDGSLRPTIIELVAPDESAT
ncbi:hypothetical protein Q7270_10890, partial [Glaesserella parasuis]|nr:hypothetical protein [Glaesserella parasuis]